MVALLSPDRLFRSELVQRILDEQGASEPGLQPETNAMADEQFIIFRLGNQDYGIPIAAVSEIARPPEHITRLPKSPAVHRWGDELARQRRADRGSAASF